MVVTITPKKFIKWDTIKIGREGYFVEYHPARTDDTIAKLYLVFTSIIPKEEVAQILEKEFYEFVTKYPAYTFATACDEKEDPIKLKDVRPDDQITGFYNEESRKIEMIWGLMRDEQVPAYIREEEHLKKIYNGLAFKTGEQCAADTELYIRRILFLKKILKKLVFAELFILPLIKMIPFISIPLKLRSFGKAVSKWKKYTGERKPTQQEIEKEKKEQQIKQLIDHIERNPEGFERLKAENFERESRERVQKETKLLQQSPSNLDFVN
jgi:hypothetical protein